MNGIDLVKFGCLHSGTNQGLLSFHVHFDGTVMTPDDMTTLIIDLLKRAVDTKYKHVLLTGKFGPDAQMWHITHTLKSRGYLVGAVISGDIAYQWLKNVNWTIVERDATPWSGFSANEFHYLLADEADGDPTVPEPSTQCVLYLCPAKSITPERVLAFMENSAYSWRIMVRPGKFYERVLFKL